MHTNHEAIFVKIVILINESLIDRDSEPFVDTLFKSTSKRGLHLWCANVRMRLRESGGENLENRLTKKNLGEGIFPLATVETFAL